MEPFILDSPFALAWCFRDEQNARTDEIRNWLKTTYALAPPLWKWEIANGLLVAFRRKRISQEDALDALAQFDILQIHTDPDWRHVPSVALFQLANANTLTIYDAAYLHLAQRLNYPLATLDGPLTTAAAKAGVRLL